VEQGATLRFATASAEDSSAGKVLQAWAKAVSKKSKRAVAVKVYFRASQGSDAAVVAKMRAGQLDGAVLTGAGLAALHGSLAVMEMPGLVDDWSQFDSIQTALVPEFRRLLAAEGIHLVGDVSHGAVRIFSKGAAVGVPSELRGRAVHERASDPLAVVRATVLGYSPVVKSEQEVLEALRIGLVDVVRASSLEATERRWAGALSNVLAPPCSRRVSAVVLRQGALAALPGEHRKLVEKTAAKMAVNLRKRLRKEDRKAQGFLRGRLSETKLDAAQLAAWRGAHQQVRRELSKGTFPTALVRKVEQLAGR
jgi:TRAP-type C4-dicarboxylate transport system substrate-binding protein